LKRLSGIPFATILMHPGFTFKLSHVKRILVVEDDKDILFITKYVLEKRGHTVFPDDTGENVHIIIKDKKPDLILLDIRLPYKSGTDLCKEIKGYCNTPVVLFSAHANIINSFHEYKADAFISKPFNLKDLETVVKKHLDAALT
jgi:DNA-binding response OmpR family regulator